MGLEMEQAVRVLLVGDAGGPAAALGAVATRRPVLRVVGPVSVAEGARALGTMPADVVVVDVDPSVLTSALTELRLADPHVRVLVRGVAGSSLASLVLEAGGCGVLPIDLDAAGIRKAVLRARAGELVLDDIELRSVVARIADERDAREAHGVSSLTTRELEVLRSLADGLSTREIADRLGISPMTVQSHVKNLLAKLGVHSKVEAVRVAWREGISAVPA